MCNFARGYCNRGLPAYSGLRDVELAVGPNGYGAHQREVRTSYLDVVAHIVAGDGTATIRLHGLTEEEQFA